MSAPDERYPADLSPDEFRRLGYRAIDLLAEYFDGFDERRVYPEADPASVGEVFDEPVPETGQDPDAILDEFEEQVLAHAAFNTSPRFFAFVMGSGSMVGVIAEALAAGLNMNVGGWHPAPSATEVERRTVECWPRRRPSSTTSCARPPVYPSDSRYWRQALNRKKPSSRTASTTTGMTT